MAVVRVNTIMTPREELAEIEKFLEDERAIRQANKINGDPDYFNRQKEILEEQIRELQGKLTRLHNSHRNSEEEIKASFERTKKLKKRRFLLRNRDKVERIEKLKKQIEGLSS